MSTQPDETQPPRDPVAAAAATYILRSRRAERPQGHDDRGGRWYPADTERRPCCGRVRSPSRAWPSSYYVHCLTAEHIAHLYDVDPREVRRAARRIAAR